MGLAAPDELVPDELVLGVLAGVAAGLSELLLDDPSELLLDELESDELLPDVPFSEPVAVDAADFDLPPRESVL